MSTIETPEDSEPNCSDSNPGEDKTFINKLLVEMKSQFNRSEGRRLMDTEDVREDSVEVKEENEEAKAGSDCEEEDDEEGKGKPRIVLTFRKPAVGKGRAKPKFEQNSKEITPKRSSRRRSKECNGSVLQSAIARKEKSYNESSKPQRLTRQLKPTQKILDNIASAASKLEKNKVEKPDSDANSEEDSEPEERDISGKKHKHKRTKCGKGGLKRAKVTSREAKRDSDSDYSELKLSDSSSSLSESNRNEEKVFRRSQRISVSRCKDGEGDVEENSCSLSELNIAENGVCPSNSSNTSVKTEQPASLCLCTENTQIYAAANENELIYCTAIDSIGDKTVGCNSVVNVNEHCLLRPSYRVPYVVLCNVHHSRMLRHNCCPTCGLFCTQGKFVECEARHQYHKECQLQRGDRECCPHCGLSTPSHSIQITMHSSNKPVLLPTRRHFRSVGSPAKMTFGKTEASAVRNASPALLSDEMIDVCLNKCVTGEEKFEIADLLGCIDNGDIERLSMIIASGQIHLNTPLSACDGGTVLHCAAKSGLVPAVHMLRVAGAEVDGLDKEQNTPLTVAILSSKNDVVKYLIKAGANLTLKGTDGMTPIHLAAKSGNLKACELLLDAACAVRDYINSEDDGGWTPLVWACEHGHTEVARYLIKKGADLHRRDVEQNLALHWASFSDGAKIVELLTSCGSEVNSTNVHGDTALHIAARQSNYNTVLILLARGADVSAINKLGETPLDCSAQCNLCYKAIALNFHLLSVTPAQNQRIILSNDISKGRENNPIQCVNAVDDEQEPTDYVYVSKNCFTSDVEIDCKISTVQSCRCENRCDSGGCLCGNNSVRCWYDPDGRLTVDFNYNDPPLIFECNEACACNTITCRNRVVQRGSTHYFQLFKTANRGWSVRTLNDIPKGSFVCEYVGEIITDEEAEQREDDSFLFELDNRQCFKDSDVEMFCIDARHYGNLTRFINHSCEANLLPVRVFVDHHDLRFPRIALFTKREVCAMEELSFDYGEKFWAVKSKQLKCNCEAPTCRYNSMS